MNPTCLKRNEAVPLAPPAFSHVSATKRRLANLHARHAEYSDIIHCALQLKTEVDAEIEEVEAELAAAVAAPVDGGVDPTLWLPDELMIMILLRVVILGGCASVCRRWERLCGDHVLMNELWTPRWQAYEGMRQQPVALRGHEKGIRALAVGIDGKVYSGSDDATVKVWSGTDGSHVRTLRGHTRPVTSLAIGVNGRVYSGSRDGTIRVWHGKTGGCLGTYCATTTVKAGYVTSLVANETWLFSGIANRTTGACIAWRCPSGSSLTTLHGLTAKVLSLELDNSDRLYTGSSDKTIRVWSASKLTHIHTLTGHMGWITSLTVGIDALYSSCSDGTTRVWSTADWTPLWTVREDSTAHKLAVGHDGTLFSTHLNAKMSVRRKGERHCKILPRPVVETYKAIVVTTMTVTRHGRLYSGYDNGFLLCW